MMRTASVSVGFLFAIAVFSVFAAEPEWNPANVKECDRACPVDFMNRYMDAI